MNGKQDEMTADGWAWMLHGDVGEDNSKPGVLNEKDSAPGQWIESGSYDANAYGFRFNKKYVF